MNERFSRRPRTEFPERSCIQLYPLDSKDIAHLELRPFEEEILDLNVLTEMSKNGEWFVIRDVTKWHGIVCIGGRFEVWPGVWEVFIVPDTKMPKYIKHVLRLAKEKLNEWMKEAHRLQTSSVDDARHTNFMEHLGFECEGTMRQFTPLKRDYKMWARIK